MNKVEEKKTEEEKRQYKSEHKKFLEWRDTVLLIDQGDILNLSLFKINNNLKRIADSLDAIFLKL
ncbi:hypothetical protein ES705_23783 [subsurface metagenome]